MTKMRKRPVSGQQSKRPPKPAAKELLKDIAILQGPTEDGEGARMLRFKEGSVYAGEVRPVREGQPVEHHELVRLKPLDPDLPVCEVEVLHTPKALQHPRKSGGPARVTTDGYRRNWSAVFGRSRDKTWTLN